MEGSGEKKINYRQLQCLAKGLRLPGNLKYNLLVEIIEARKNGKEDIVEKILAEQKLERDKRKKEKLEAKEAAYQHLHLYQDTKEEKSLQPYQQDPSPTKSDSSNSLWQGYKSNRYPKDIRSVLRLPVESFQELLRKARNKELCRIQRNERPMTFREVLTLYFCTSTLKVELILNYQATLNQRLMLPSQNVFQDLFLTISDDETCNRDDLLRQNSNSQVLYSQYGRGECPTPRACTSVQGEMQGPPTKKTSFQMKDILGENNDQWCADVSNMCPDASLGSSNAFASASGSAFPGASSHVFTGASSSAFTGGGSNVFTLAGGTFASVSSCAFTSPDNSVFTSAGGNAFSSPPGSMSAEARGTGPGYPQVYSMPSPYEVNQVSCEASPMSSCLPDPYMPNYSYMVSSENWRNMYNLNQNNCNSRYVDCCTYPVNSGSGIEDISPPNSETMSATDEGITKEPSSFQDNYKYNNQTTYPHQNYSPLPSYQKNTEKQDSTFAPTNPAPVVENRLEESLHPVDRSPLDMQVSFPETCTNSYWYSLS